MGNCYTTTVDSPELVQLIPDTMSDDQSNDIEVYKNASADLLAIISSLHESINAMEIKSIDTDCTDNADNTDLRECCICLEDTIKDQDYVKLLCTHSVCISCYHQLYDKTPCPVCRQTMKNVDKGATKHAILCFGDHNQLNPVNYDYIKFIYIPSYANIRCERFNMQYNTVKRRRKKNRLILEKDVTDAFVNRVKELQENGYDIVFNDMDRMVPFLIRKLRVKAEVVNQMLCPSQ